MKVKDERLTQTQNKIYREIYYLIMGLILLSILIKFLMFGFTIEHVVTELVLASAQSIYYSIRAARTGLLSSEVDIHDRNSRRPMRVKTTIFGLVTGVVLALCLGINSAVNYADGTGQAISYFLSVFFVSLLIYVPFLSLVMALSYRYFKRKSDKAIERELESFNEE